MLLKNKNQFPQANLKRAISTLELPTIATFPDQLLPKEQAIFQTKLKQSHQRRLQNSFCQVQSVPLKNGYPQESNFNQQWQHKTHKDQVKNIEILIVKSQGEKILAFCIMLCFAFTIWLATVEFFFGSNKESFVSSLVYLAPTFVLVMNFLETSQAKQFFDQSQYKKLITHLIKPTMYLLYLVLKTIQVNIQSSWVWLLLELPCLSVLFSKASQFYKCFRVMNLSKKYQYHFKAFDLLFNLMIVAHVVSIILYQTSLAGEEVTWRTQLNIDHKSSLINYIYSYYFGVTTILTVGYGDIVPKNHIQIAVVCFVELFGIAIFAYLINEIGYNLSSLRKDNEAVERDLSVLEKCRQYYKMDQNLIAKARMNILNSKEAINRLKPEEEKSLVLKFNETLRKEIMTNNTLSILKSSIFFLCRWSKQFQMAMAQSLVSALYMPGEELLQTPGNQKIYIIRLGKVNFYRKQKGNKKDAQKVIKSLQVTLNTEVTNNSFGYTSVIGRKPTDLEVISKDFTSVYFVTKQNFLRCIRQNPCDYQYYQEIKDKIEQSNFPQALQVPTLNARKMHFNPSKYFIIKKEAVNINHLRNKRVSIQRQRKRIQWCNLQKIEHEQGENASHVLISSIDDALRKEALQERHKTTTASNDHKTHSTCFPSLGFAILQFGMKQYISKGNEIIEVGKEYTNYFPSSNIEQVLLKNQRANKSQIRQATDQRRIKKSKFALQRSL